VRVDAKHRVWNAEMRIPLSSMNAAGVKPGIEWRVNFFRAAEKGPDPQRKFLAWSTIPEGTTFTFPAALESFVLSISLARAANSVCRLSGCTPAW